MSSSDEASESGEELPLGIEVYGSNEAPGRANTQKMLVELTAPSFSEDGKKPALDLVAVLDVSGSMRGHKLHNLKSAMNYVIKKLGAKDRLAVIPFATDVKHPFKLKHMSKDRKHKAASFVHGLEAHGETNISAALEAGLKVLHERAHKDGRAAAVFLMSDGRQNRGGDAKNVAGVAHFTVDTFGFGSDHGPKVLAAIATKSLGGTYHYVRDDHGATLTTSFSQPLAGLRSVVLLGLKLTLRPRGNSTIHRVDPGGYPQKKHADGSVTVDFGHLYRDETRRVLVFLHLPAVRHDHTGTTVMTAEAVYSIPGHGKITDSRPFLMDRKGGANGYPLRLIPRVKSEQVRGDHVGSIRKIMHAADNEELHDARTMLAGALKALKEILEEDEEEDEEDADDDSKEMVESLVVELKHFRGHMVSLVEYRNHGRAYALASISSHERQRFTARGDVDHVRLFTTPRMDKYLEQAGKFHKNPNVHI